MITDAQTNKVYFSELLKTKLKYADFYKRLIAILDKRNINYQSLKDTNDIWCRDFMPVQATKNKFIEYRYDPDYLQSKQDRRLKSYPDLVCDSNNFKTIKSDLILDGGNVIKGKDKVILTDKIISENFPKYLKAQILSKLKELFEVDTVILIPQVAKETYGHADGMIRFIDDERVLVDGYYVNRKPEFKDKYYQILKANHLTPVELTFSVRSQSYYNWGYLNFLQMKDLILFPEFGIDEDSQALDQIKQLFPDYAAKGKIETINCMDIIRGNGGVLNCISWSIME